MTPEHELTLWAGSCRYYLGRTSYAVGEFCDLLIDEWPALDPKTCAIIRHDVEEAFGHYEEMRRHGGRPQCLGHDCDRRSWENVRRLWEVT